MLIVSQAEPQAARSIKQQISRLLFIVSVTMAVIIAVLSFMLVSINRQYAVVLSCANTAADFNKEFKSTLDHEMYNHVIRPRSGDSVLQLGISSGKLPSQYIPHTPSIS